MKRHGKSCKVSVILTIAVMVFSLLPIQGFASEASGELTTENEEAIESEGNTSEMLITDTQADEDEQTANSNSEPATQEVTDENTSYDLTATASNESGNIIPDDEYSETQDDSGSVVQEQKDGEEQENQEEQEDLNNISLQDVDSEETANNETATVSAEDSAEGTATILEEEIPELSDEKTAVRSYASGISQDDLDTMLNTFSPETTTREFVNIQVSGTRYYDYAFELLDLINDYREESGLEPFVMNQSILEYSMTRAEECSMLFAHCRSWGDAIAYAHSYALGENIAAGYSTAEDVFNGWKNSSGHNALMKYTYTLDGDCDQYSVGIGFVIVGGRAYAVLNVLKGVADVTDEAVVTSYDSARVDFNHTIALNTSWYEEGTMDAMVYFTGSTSSYSEVASDGTIYVTSDILEDYSLAIRFLWGHLDEGINAQDRHWLPLVPGDAAFKVTVKEASDPAIVTIDEYGNLTFTGEEGYITYEITLDGTDDTWEVPIVYCNHANMALSSDKSVAATCTATGYDVYVCQNEFCGYEQKRTTKVISHDYQFSAWADGETEPTSCLEEAEATYVCSVCGAETTKTTTGEHVTEVVTLEPTCDTLGATYDYCSVCEKYFNCRDEVDALGHDYSTSKVVTAATCSKEGKLRWYCSRCSSTETEAIPIDSDAHACTRKKTAATCTEQGYYTYTCLYCGYSYIADYIDSLGHSYDTNKDGEVDAKATGTITAEPTCTEKGVRTYYCSRCDTSVTEEIAELGHDYVATVTEPTCIEQGYTTYTCQRDGCDYSYIDTYVDATGHYYKETITHNPTCTTLGEYTYTCLVCGDSYTEEIPMVEHKEGAGTVTTAATCTTTGVMTYYCASCGTELRTETINALGHDIKDEVTNPTCTAQGYTTHTCQRDGCDYSYADTYVEETGHDYQAAEVVGPTCAEKGYTTYVCSRCDDSYNADYTDATGKHIYTYDPKTHTATCETCGAIVEGVYMLGDVNGDGKVGSNDVSWLAIYLNGTSSSVSEFVASAQENFNACDVTNNGKIGSKDLSYLEKYISGNLSLDLGIGKLMVDGSLLNS